MFFSYRFGHQLSHNTTFHCLCIDGHLCILIPDKIRPGGFFYRCFFYSEDEPGMLGYVVVSHISQDLSLCPPPFQSLNIKQIAFISLAGLRGSLSLILVQTMIKLAANSEVEDVDTTVSLGSPCPWPSKYITRDFVF